jgi:putative spermidine/putrescine transport system substrate-binding protein
MSPFKKNIMKKISLFLILLILASCSKKKEEVQENFSKLPWSTIEKQAKGKEVSMIMWMGDAKINQYMKNYIVPKVKKENGINLQIIDGQGSAVVQLLMTEQQANKSESDIDLMWINGETFYQLKQINALFGPWTSLVPNTKYIDFKNPFIGTDFQQPINGFEMPWGNVQLTVIYNNKKVQNPPQTRADLLAFVKKNPGIFTFDNQFTGLTFLKGLLIDISGSKEELAGPFDAVKYQKYSTKLWAYIKELKPYLWRQGSVFPESVAQTHQLFANGELWFTMSNNDAEVDSKIQEGLFPETTQAYVPSFGSIQNSHYIGIPANSGNKAAAMVVANALVSIEAQVKKMNPTVWGDGTILDLSKLSPQDKAKFESIPARIKSPKRTEIQDKALKELAPEYMVKLAEDFRKNIINN